MDLNPSEFWLGLKWNMVQKGRLYEFMASQ